MLEYIKLEPLRDEFLNDDFDCDIVNHFLGIVDSQPAADVVEVVRCKECKYFLHDTDYCKKHNAGYCEFDNQIKARLHFCGLAIKKEGAEEWLK